jgi:4-hydroxythreonine-4-phosphate dehydrogenase
MSSQLPIIALTTGDPAGVGPEIVVKALAEGSWAGHLVPVVIGDAAIVEQVVEGCQLELKVRTIASPEEATATPGVVELLDCGVVDTVVYGAVDAAAGRAAIAYIERACELAREGRVHGLVTGPINKEAIWAAGSPFLGHTEMLAHLFAVPEQDAVTMFLLGKMKIFFLTRHHSLRDAVDLLDEDMIARFLGRVQEVIGDLGVTDPYLALAALNPHGGENGNLGVEERDILAPGVAKARKAGVNVVGPVPADAVFYQARQGKYDGVIALHHDQGHIAAKTVDFFGTVACELGLPVIRTTVDHGTAFDIAGKWQADARGQTAALLAAAEMAPLVLASHGRRAANV